MEGNNLDEQKPVSEWKNKLTLILTSKKDEFHMLGYEKTTEEDIWNCLRKLVWEKNDPSKRMYEVVSDIFQLQITTYMTYLTMDMYEENDDLMASISALRGD